MGTCQSQDSVESKDGKKREDVGGTFVKDDTSASKYCSTNNAASSGDGGTQGNNNNTNTSNEQSFLSGNSSSLAFQMAKDGDKVVEDPDPFDLSLESEEGAPMAHAPGVGSSSSLSLPPAAHGSTSMPGEIDTSTEESADAVSRGVVDRKTNSRTNGTRTGGMEFKNPYDEIAASLAPKSQDHKNGNPETILLSLDSSLSGEKKSKAPQKTFVEEYGFAQEVLPPQAYFFSSLSLLSVRAPQEIQMIEKNYKGGFKHEGAKCEIATQQQRWEQRSREILAWNSSKDPKVVRGDGLLLPHVAHYNEPLPASAFKRLLPSKPADTRRFVSGVRKIRLKLITGQLMEAALLSDVQEQTTTQLRLSFLNGLYKLCGMKLRDLGVLENQPSVFLKALREQDIERYRARAELVFGKGCFVPSASNVSEFALQQSATRVSSQETDSASEPQSFRAPVATPSNTDITAAATSPSQDEVSVISTKVVTVALPSNRFSTESGLGHDHHPLSPLGEEDAYHAGGRPPPVVGLSVLRGGVGLHVGEDVHREHSGSSSARMSRCDSGMSGYSVGGGVLPYSSSSGYGPGRAPSLGPGRQLSGSPLPEGARPPPHPGLARNPSSGHFSTTSVLSMPCGNSRAFAHLTNQHINSDEQSVWDDRSSGPDSRGGSVLNSPTHSHLTASGSSSMKRLPSPPPVDASGEYHHPLVLTPEGVHQRPGDGGGIVDHHLLQSGSSTPRNVPQTIDLHLPRDSRQTRKLQPGEGTLLAPRGFVPYMKKMLKMEIFYIILVIECHLVGRGYERKDREKWETEKPDSIELV